MAIVSPDSFATSLSNGIVFPIYLLFGEEEFLIDEALELLLERFVDDTVRSFNFDQYHGSDADLREVVERSMAYPMMAERRVVLVRNIEKRLAGRKDAEKGVFTSMLENFPETTILILTAETTSFLGRGKAKAKEPWNRIIEEGTAVQFKKIYDREVPGWIARRISAAGKKIDPEGVELFSAYVGSSLRTIHNEIDKLFTFVEDRPSITVEDVRMIVGASKAWNVFELQKAIGEKKVDLALEIGERMIAAGEPIQVILTMLTRYFTMLWRLLEIRARSRDRNEMARLLGIPSFFLDEYLSATNRYGLPGIRSAFDALLATDLALKTERTESPLVMQLLITSIVRSEPLLFDRSRTEAA
jgi:DNA polymerase-3 subunit delta